MKPKLAYIDYTLNLDSPFIEILKREVEVTFAKTFEDFLKDNDLNSFSVLLCHPGLRQFHNLSKIVKDYPTLSLALITSAKFDYFGSDLPIFSYSSHDAVINYVKENQ